MKDYTTSTDQALWLQMNSGDRKALEHIYRKHYKDLFNYGMKIFFTKEVVEDSIHELFIKIYTRKYHLPSINIRSYLLGSLKNIIIDRLERDNKIVYDDIEKIPFDFSFDEEAIWLAKHKTDEELAAFKKIKSTLNLLSYKQKHILYLRFILELNYNEIGSILDVTPQSAMNLLSRTLSKMRKSIIK